MPSLASTMRIFEPWPNLLAFYDGRIPGRRMFGERANWFDDGAFELGMASYALIDGGEGLVYDTHMSCEHAGIVRDTLRARGVERPRVVLSHWHTDHVAGNEVFADCEILAQPATFELLDANRASLESGFPPIAPLVMPTASVEDGDVLTVGQRRVTVHLFDIHSRDGTTLSMNDGEIFLAGDTLEDPVTYVAEPDRLDHHLHDLERLEAMAPRWILPNHGAPERIEAGGYGPELIAATRRYVEALQRMREDGDGEGAGLDAILADDIASGAVGMIEPYRRVHEKNVASVRALASTRG